MNRMTTTVFGLALIVLLCGTASATDIYVNQTGWWNATGDTTFHAIAPGQIQAAIDNATADDTIYVYNGTYNENVKVETPHLTLEGEGADVVTVTAAASDDHVFNVTANYVNITGFNVTGATDNWSAGVHLQGADHCNISNNIASGNDLYGIYLFYSSDNMLTGNDCSGNGYDGIRLSASSGNMLTGNDCSGNDDIGIRLEISSDNNTLTGNNCSGNDYGIRLRYSDDNTLTGNDCSGNDDIGILLKFSCDNNTLTGNDCSGNTRWGFYSYVRSLNNTYVTLNNTVKDLTVASYPTTISFTYENGIAITGVKTPPTDDPTGKANIGKYVNATNVTADSLLFLNVSYDNSDIAGLDESSLLMWRHDGAAWDEVAGSGVNVDENYVYATITEFSVFAPMGDPATAFFNITKTDDASGCVYPGDMINYTICYENPIPQPVHNVIIPDHIPVNATFVSASDSGEYDPVNHTVTWDIGTLAPEEAGCVYLTVSVNEGTGGTTLMNCAAIDGDEVHKAGACEYTDVCKYVHPLSITKTDDASGCVDPGDLITYTICYDNLANPTQGVTNVTIIDTLPADVTFVSASDSGTHAAGVVTWNIGDLDENAAEACVTLTVRVNTGTEGQTLTNCATIDSTETDPATACEHTVVCEATPPPTPVPAATPPGIALMIGLLAVAGSVMLRRRE